MHDSKKIVSIDSIKPDPDIIIKAGKIILKNGIVIFPAKCLYGVAANALEKKAVEKVFQLKQRPLDNPILILISNRTMLLDLVKKIPKTAEKLIDTFWPGSLTLIFEAKDHISPLLTAGTGKIGVRIPVHPIAKALVDYVGTPITGTSANLSGQKSCNNPDFLNAAVTDPADLVLDAGILKGGIGSTIVDITGPNINLIREGEISANQITQALRK
ncbi:MAG: threonylcarbamoyl-AMP synthase [Desulfobacteraceae bacterium]|nr:threonylcarbamoyl-AMP synthase [Desulfobacteraceae bacterium]